MEFVNWSFGVIDKIFITRRVGNGEQPCPQGSFPAGYAEDSWGKWRNVCLTELSIEDVEDAYLIGTMITGGLLMGLSVTLLYRHIRKVVTAVKGPLPLSTVIEGSGRALNAVHARLDNILERISTLQAKIDRIGDQSGQ